VCPGGNFIEGKEGVGRERETTLLQQKLVRRGQRPAPGDLGDGAAVAQSNLRQLTNLRGADGLAGNREPLSVLEH